MGVDFDPRRHVRLGDSEFSADVYVIARELELAPRQVRLGLKFLMTFVREYPCRWQPYFQREHEAISELMRIGYAVFRHWPNWRMDDPPEGSSEESWEVNSPSSTASEPCSASGQWKKRPISPALRWEVFKRDGYTCKRCGGDRDLAADHIIPESKGGPTTLDNLQTLCRSCNSRKGNRE